MKKIPVILLTAAISFSATAQSLVTKTLKPVEERNFKVEEETSRIGGQMCSNSFVLKSPDGGLIASKEQSFVTYGLNGQYAKLTFIYSPANANPNGISDSGILVVSADGRTILDEVVHDYDEIRYKTLDINGVQRITFKHVKGAYHGRQSLSKPMRTNRVP